MEYFKTNTKFEIETFKEKIKSVVLEKYEFETRDEAMLKKLLEVLHYQDSSAGTNLSFSQPNTLQGLKTLRLRHWSRKSSL